MNPNLKFMPDWILNRSVHKAYYNEMMVIKKIAEKTFNDPDSPHALAI